MGVILHPDPMSATLLTSEPLVLSTEQQNYIKEILDICCSDSKFAEKAYLAIWKVLTSGSVVPPVAVSLSPDSAALGSPSFTLHVIGTGFTPTSQIIWNGSAEPTVFVSATELTTEVDMSTAAVAIPIPVAVLNSDGVQSDVITFTLTEAVSGGTTSTGTGTGTGTIPNTNTGYAVASKKTVVKIDEKEEKK
jgi:hypothetical protein